MRVKGLPPEIEFGDRQEVLAAQLWEHFQYVLQQADARERQKKRGNGSPGTNEQPRAFDIADITFAKQTIEHTEALMSLWDVYKEYKKCENNANRKFEDPKTKAKYDERYANTKELYKQAKINYQKEQ